MKYENIKPGERFLFAGYNWTKLKNNTAISTEALWEQPFDYKAIQQRWNDWRTSPLRKELNTVFFKQLIENGANKDDFEQILTKFVFNNEDYGSSLDTVALMGIDDYEENRTLIKKVKDVWWLITPFYDNYDPSKAVLFVNTSDDSWEDDVSYAIADANGIMVRPIIKLKQNTEVEIEE